MRIPFGFRIGLAGAIPIALIALSFVSCSANSESNTFNQGGGGGGNEEGGTATDGSAANSGGPLFEASTGDGQLDEESACVGQSFPGKLAPLDVYILLDATGSMQGSNNSPVVWPSVVAALKDIISDPLSSGIGVGLTYLPNQPPPTTVIPGSCKPGGDCGALGLCEFIGIAFACTSACTKNEDCGLYGPCMPWMTPKTPNARVCNGALVPKVSCDPLDYGQPVVPIAPLPGNKDALVQAINDKDPDGDATPTQPSLEGTLIYAKQYAKDNPTHLVHVLFATDGEPNNCTFNTIDGAAVAAATAFSNPPSVPTFVLGIGDLKDLNAIAKAGGTGDAYLANGSTVASQLVTVFNQIRASGACQFQIPEPESGQTLDFDRVNVYYTPLASSEKVPVKYVNDAASCDPKEGGWYYDDPSKTNPTKILLCPATCEGVKLSEEGVEVLLGCKTILK